MKLPIPLLLYLVSLGLFGLAGWTVYEMLPLWKDEARQKATRDGQDKALDRLKSGKGRGPSLDWNYSHGDWWAALKNVNLVGKLPPPPKPVGGPEEAPKAPLVELRPLAEIIELVSLVHDGEAKGRGGNTYVIVRYKPGADVKPPEWYIRQNMTGPAAVSAPGPRDSTPASRPSGPRGGRGGQPAPASPPSAPSKTPGAATPIPTSTSMGGREIVQKVWVVDEGDPMRGNRLWPTFDNIKLVGVSSDAQVAYFVRDLPPPKEGEPAPEPKEESLLKTNMYISPELLEKLRSMQGRAAPTASSSTPVLSPSAGVWIDMPETKVVNGVTHISKRDEERFSNPDELLSQFHVDTYSGKTVKGLIVRSVDAKLARTLGIAAGEVLIELNGRAVRSRNEALEIGKGDYRRGVRTFVTKWLANGAVIERTWQAPDR